MSTPEHTDSATSEVHRVESMAQTSAADCYQCAKCTAGCPMAEVMDVRPHQVMRLLQVDKVDKARGMNVTVVTTAKTDEEGRELLSLFGMPFRN